MEEGGPWGVGQWRLDWGGNGGQGGFAGLTSRCESLLVHIFFPFGRCQLQEEDSDVEKQVPLTTSLVASHLAQCSPHPLSTWF